MTQQEIEEGNLFLERLREKGFFDFFIEELRQQAVARQKDTGKNYVQCLQEVFQEEMAQMQCAIIHDENHVEFIKEPKAN